MTTKTQDAPGETGQELNDPQPDIADEPGRAIGYAIYHPDHGFAETCSSSIEDFTENQNAGMAILLYRQRDVAAADRLERGWSDKAQIIPVRIPDPRFIAPRSPIARRPKEVHPTTLYGLRLCDGSNAWFAGNESETLDGGPNVKYTPVFDSLDDARKYLADAKMTEAAPGGDDNDRAYAIMPLVVAQANDETSDRSEDFDANEPEPIPSVGEQIASADNLIVQVTLIREGVRQLQQRLEDHCPGGLAALHTLGIEDRRPWIDPLNELNSADGDLLDLIAHLCVERDAIHAEVVTD